MGTSFFFGCKTSDEVRNRYDELARVFNPTKKGESNEMISTINDQYDRLMKVLDEPKPVEAVKEKISLSKKIEELQSKINPEGLHFEVCGSWIWISGRTYMAKDILKSAGFKYSPHKQSWYFRNEENRSNNQDPLPMDQIRELYGSQEIALR
jgi:hypothetical protein